MSGSPLAQLPPVAPTGSRARAREAAIVEATLELLLEVGYERLTIDAVAERARASKATIYRHFPDKAALVVASLGREQHEELGIDTGSLRGDLLAFAALSSGAGGAEGGLLCGLMNAARSDESIAAHLNERMWESKQRALRPIVERAVARGELADAARFAVACEVCCAVVLHRLSVERLELDEEFRRHLVDEIAIPLLTSGGTPPGGRPAVPAVPPGPQASSFPRTERSIRRATR